MRITFAPDSFKGGPSAGVVAQQLAEGWRSVRPADHLSLRPMADGGEGTAAVIATAVAGARRRQVAHVAGPDGGRAVRTYVELPDGTAVVEVAEAAGLPLMNPPDVMKASTFGVGQLLRAARIDGARRILVAAGGSASCDGGVGALGALGLRFIACGGGTFSPDAGSLIDIAGVDADALLEPPSDGVAVLVDVDAPLLGPGGAAPMFGPQKGATPDQVVMLDDGLKRLAALGMGRPDTPGSGAAGGLAFGLQAWWGAAFERGSDFLADIINLQEAIDESALVVTGEGRFDAGSLTGKVCGEVIRRAAGRTPVAVVAGVIDDDVRTAVSQGVDLTTLAGSRAAALARPLEHLRHAGRMLAREFTS